jgi:hypothetical protein
VAAVPGDVSPTPTKKTFGFINGGECVHYLSFALLSWFVLNRNGHSKIDVSLGVVYVERVPWCQGTGKSFTVKKNGLSVSLFTQCTE